MGAPRRYGNATSRVEARMPLANFRPASRRRDRAAGGALPQLVVIIGLVIALIYVAYLLVGVAADSVADRLPDQWEADTFGNLAAKQPGWRDTATTTGERTAAGAFKKLISAPDLRRLRYRLYFMDEPLPNAFSLPGGAVGVTQGLLKLVETEIGLAMVLGHELGHQQFRHSLKAMGRSLVTGVVISLAIGGDAGSFVGAGLGLAERAHSRDQERQADEYGLRLVYRLYGTTKGALEFFNKLEAKAETHDNKWLSMLSTHPYTPDRIEAMTRLSATLEGSAGGGGNGHGGLGLRGVKPKGSKTAKPGKGAKSGAKAEQQP
jgi:Zn-dependent protease with chaperone function